MQVVFVNDDKKEQTVSLFNVSTRDALLVIPYLERTLEKEIGGKIDCLPILEPECKSKKPVIGSKMDACFIVYLTAVLAINAAIEQSWWQVGCWAFVALLWLYTAISRFRRDTRQ